MYLYIHQVIAVFFYLKSSLISELALSASFNNLFYGSTAIINIFNAGIDFRRQNILTSKVDRAL